MKLTRINTDRISLLKNFLEHAGNSLEHFRYYNSLDFAVLKNHLVTYIIEENGQALAYGHLDKENEIVWLGTCIIENERGKGLGKKIMEALLSFAVLNNIDKIKLSVDNVNEAARSLYKNYGFKETEKKEEKETKSSKYLY